MDYKSYQQVLDLSGPKQTVGKCKAKSTKAPGAVKKRTKSGCLTCRGRKKKCDENKIDGKCQACIRNFLDCCWPTTEASPAPNAALAPVEHATLPSVKQTPIKAKLELADSNRGASAYPSPLSSPKLITVEEKHENHKKTMHGIMTTNKICKPKKAPRAVRENMGFSQFVVTSFNKDRNLCQLESS